MAKRDGRAARLRAQAESIGQRAALAMVLASYPVADEWEAESAAELAAVAYGLARAAVLIETWEDAELLAAAMDDDGGELLAEVVQ